MDVTVVNIKRMKWYGFESNIDNLSQLDLELKYTRKVDTSVMDLIYKRNKLVETSLEEYLLFTYNKTPVDVKSVLSRFHNVKLKGFHCITQNKVVHYFDGDKEFLTVGEDVMGWYIIKHWEK